MSTKTKKKFMDSVKETGGKIKTKVKETGSKVKSYAKTYKEDMERAYNIGYAQGWEDGVKIPSRVGAQTSAVTGYRNGMNNRRKTDKAQKKYNQLRGK